MLRGPHVDLHYYPEEDELARMALAYAEESYGVLQRRFNHHAGRRIPLIIYASHTDFEQTNILPFVPPEGLLGVTELLKQRVALPFNGSYADFRHTIRHELVHVFQLSLTVEVMRRYPRMRHLSFPLWWTEGLAEFWSAGPMPPASPPKEPCCVWPPSLQGGRSPALRSGRRHRARQRSLATGLSTISMSRITATRRWIKSPRRTPARSR